MDKLQQAIAGVVRNGNCSGCGGCTLVSSRITMRLSSDGFMRPVVATPDERETVYSAKQSVSRFKQTCPGLFVTAPAGDRPLNHRIFGPYTSIWESSAIDEEIRFSGSSGGVLTALTAWLLDTGQIENAVVATSARATPARTIPVTIQTREEAIAAAGSRYAPVSVLQEWNYRQSAAVIAKPCEISAATQFLEALPHRAPSVRPIMLSFFCAGTPSQNATLKLAETLGVDEAEISTLKYRGNGWPGRFTVGAVDGSTASLSYDESWGRHLGRNLQDRCKICPDGTGGAADISVGDFWNANEFGYPEFNDAAGSSVVIARTSRGHDLLLKAREAGVIRLSQIDPDRAAQVQPLQVERKVTLVGRLCGRVLAFKKIPRYHGFGLLRVQSSLITTGKATLGTFLRACHMRKG